MEPKAPNTFRQGSLFLMNLWAVIASPMSNSLGAEIKPALSFMEIMVFKKLTASFSSKVPSTKTLPSAFPKSLRIKVLIISKIIDTVLDEGKENID